VIRLAIRVRRADAEIALAELLALAPSGVEEVDLGDIVEYAVYGPPGELPALPDLRAAAGEALVEVSTTEVADDWDERWKAYHQPLRLQRLTVRPPWAAADGRPGVPEVVIDPGQAFGTGAHATTRLCLELLLELEPGGAFADWGCGSGVLAIAAAKLGWAPVAGADHDPASVAATAANATANGVEVAASRLDLREAPAPWAPTAAANLMRPLLLSVAKRLERAPGRLVVSGLLVHESDEVAGAFGDRGLREIERREHGEWAALLLGSEEA
jgi:ribosomal protein L11 methyltransferase